MTTGSERAVQAACLLTLLASLAAHAWVREATHRARVVLLQRLDQLQILAAIQLEAGLARQPATGDLDALRGLYPGAELAWRSGPDHAFLAIEPGLPATSSAAPQIGG